MKRFAAALMVSLALPAALSSLSSLSSTAYAQDAEAQVFQPFVGVVTRDDVYVRSGWSERYYPLGKLNTGDFVDVEKEEWGWYAIKPLPGSFSYISKTYVRLDADGKTGTLTGDRVKVYAPSPDGTAQSYKTQIQLSTGETVKVLGEVDDYYKIETPAGARQFISAGYVRRATPAQLAARAAAAQPVAPAIDNTVETATGTATTTTTTTTTEVTITAPAPEAVTRVVEAPAGTTATEPATDVAIETPADTGAADPALIIVPPPVERETPDEPAVEVAVADSPADSPADSTGEARDSLADALEPTTDTTTTIVTAETVTEPASEPDTVDVVETVTVETVEAVDVDPAELDVDTRLGLLDEKFSTESTKPLAEQDVIGLLNAYRAFSSNNELSAAQQSVVDTRIDVLTTRSTLQDTLRELEVARKKLELEKQSLADRTRTYSAVGKLMASPLYTGANNRPLLYRLVDPLNGLTIAYVSPGADRAAAVHLGRVVGIVGQPKYDAGLRLKVVTPDQIDRLAATE